MMRMDKKRVIPAVLLVALLAAGAGGYWHMTTPAAPVLSGNVDIRSVNVSFRVPGRLAQLTVDEGASVKTGMVLGQLDPAPLRHAVGEAEAALAALQARRSLYRHGYRREDIEQARATVASREAALVNASAVFARQSELAGSGASSQRLYDEARSARDQARAQLEAAQAQYQAMRQGFRVEEVAEVEANTRRAEAQLASVRLQLADTVLKAPSDGVVLTRAVEPGTLLAAGSTVFTVAVTRPVWVRAYVAEPELGRFATGTRVKVVRDGRAVPYDGVVGFVSPTAEFTPKNVETTDLRTTQVYRLRIVVTHPDDGLRQGMPVTVRLAGD